MERDIDKFKAALESMVPMTELTLGFKLDYTPQSLHKVEQYLVNQYSHRPAPYQMIILFGTYLGEMIIRNIKGSKWVDETTNGDFMDIHILTPFKGQGDAQIRPFIRIDKFIHDHTDGIYAFYAMAQDMANGRLKFDVDPNSNNFQQQGTSPRGYTYKVTSVSPELYERFEKGEITKEQMIKMHQNKRS